MNGEGVCHFGTDTLHPFFPGSYNNGSNARVKEKEN